MTDNRIKRVEKLCAVLQKLTNDQLDSIERVANQFTQPYILIEKLTSSDIINDCLLYMFGDALRIHHCFSKEPLSKDRFEYALERSSNLCGLEAELAPKGNPGYDITINGIPISLKTEASAGIRIDRVHVSKFMELGKGEWDLSLLRERYFNSDGKIKFQLYFDAGTERKLQVRNLAITYCIIHATWTFSTEAPLDNEPPLDA